MGAHRLTKQTMSFAFESGHYKHTLNTEQTLLLQ